MSYVSNLYVLRSNSLTARGPLCVQLHDGGHVWGHRSKEGASSSSMTTTDMLMYVDDTHNLKHHGVT